MNFAVLASGHGGNLQAIIKAVKKGQIKGVCDMGPATWLLVSLFLWIIAFPAYLIKRPEFIKANEK